MKKFLSVAFLTAIIFFVVPLSAHAVGASLSGPSSVESGGTVTFSVQISDSAGFTSFQANINASPGLVVQSVSSSSFAQNMSTNNMIVGAGATPITYAEVIIKCSVTGDPGETRTISLSGASASDANGNDFAVNNPSKQITVAAPKSGENRLASLSVAGYSLSPAFSENTTSYSIGKVPFEVGSVKVNATAKDSAASVSTQGTALAVGDNYVKVNVTAANGSVKTYTILVTRQQDPNYKPSSDGSVAEIAVSYGDLSPAFDPKVKEYVVYVPFEVEKMTISGRAAAQLAKGVKNLEEQELKVGVNELVLQCTAEDDSVTDYTIYVVRMDEFGGKDTLGLPASLIGAEPEQEEPTEPETEERDEAPEKSHINRLIPAGTGLICLIAGGLAGWLIPKAAKKRRDSASIENETDYFEDYDDRDYFDDEEELNDFDKEVVKFEEPQQETKVKVKKHKEKDFFDESLLDEYLDPTDTK